MDARVIIGTACSTGIGAAHGGRERNEDNFLVASRGVIRMMDEGGVHTSENARGHGLMLAVADGMGGHEQGDVASSAAVQALARLWQRGRPADPEQALAGWIPAAHARIREVLVPNGAVNMGTTLTAGWIVGDRLGWAHIGDSRLYRMRSGNLWRLTRDQTHGEFARRDRRPPGTNAAYPAQSFIYGSRGLGHDADLRLEAGVDSGTIDLTVGERLLFCSDGICGFVDDDRIGSVLARARDAQEAADDLIDVAMEAGSDDNVTAVVVHVVGLPLVVAEEVMSEIGNERTLIPWNE